MSREAKKSAEAARLAGKIAKLTKQKWLQIDAKIAKTISDLIDKLARSLYNLQHQKDGSIKYGYIDPQHPYDNPEPK